MSNSKIILTVWLALSATLTGCGGEEQSDLKGWMDEQARLLKPNLKPLPELKPFPVVSYSADGVVDPFQPSKIIPDKKPGAGTQPDLTRRKEELEKFALPEIKFVGLLRKGGQLEAVVTADKKIYRVRPGNYLGQDFGKLLEIVASQDLSEGKLILRELVQDADGDWIERKTEVELQGAAAAGGGK